MRLNSRIDFAGDILTLISRPALKKEQSQLCAHNLSLNPKYTESLRNDCKKRRCRNPGKTDCFRIGDLGRAGIHKSDEKVQAISKNVVPPELAALWSVANGETDSSEGLFGGYMFTSIEYSCDLMSDYIMLVESDELKDLRFKTAHLGETAIFETGWVPIENLFNRDLILLDTRQGSDSFGFVFKWSLETGPGKLLAKTISGFLSGILKLLTDGDIDSLDGFEAPVE